MTDAMRRGWRRRSVRSGADIAYIAGDGGMTLVEVMVACIVLTILAMGVFGVMMTGFKTTKNDKTRVAASNLAARELEIVRQQFASGSSAVLSITAPANNRVLNPDPLLTTNPPNAPLVVDGVAYNVMRSVDIQLVGPGASPCDGGTLVAHPSYAVTATVTWSTMSGTTKPVVNQTILTPPKNVVPDSTYGYLAIKVTDANSNPVSGISVQATGPGGTFADVTDASGCGVMSINQAANTYVASVSALGYVDKREVPAPSTANVSIQVGVLTKTGFSYDRAAELDATFVTAPGYNPPQTLPLITYANSGIFPSGVKTVPSTAVTTALKGLWPYPAGYTAWAGSCTDADPASEGATRNPPSVMAPGGIGSTQLVLAPLNVTVLDTSLNPAAGQIVKATEQTAAGCGADKVLTLGVTDLNGKLKTSLPYGKWALGVGAKSGAAFTMNGSVTVSTPASSEVDL